MEDANRPDVLIVGRGGGSIEDLWPFNEEAVVRAAFDSKIPLISAVGHETDTTLIDYVSDARAPTPTGAAEIAVPVRADLILTLDDYAGRQKRALARFTHRQADRLKATRMPRPERLLEAKRQALDLAASRLGGGLQRASSQKRIAFVRAAAGLRPDVLSADTRRARQSLREVAGRARPALMRYLDQRTQRLNSSGKLLETLSYQATLGRGYTIVRDPSGALVRSADKAKAKASLRITFADGDVEVSPTKQVTSKLPTPKPKPRSNAAKRPTKKKAAPKIGTASTKDDQGSLF